MLLCVAGNCSIRVNITSSFPQEPYECVRGNGTPYDTPANNTTAIIIGVVLAVVLMIGISIGLFIYLRRTKCDINIPKYTILY